MRLFEKFQEQYILCTDIIYTDDNASQLNQQFDCFIIGSDQVWNCINGINRILFLDFSDKEKMKVSYTLVLGCQKFLNNTNLILLELLGHMILFR